MIHPDFYAHLHACGSHFLEKYLRDRNNPEIHSSVSKLNQFLIAVLLWCTFSEAQSCPKGEHWVSAHHRRSYYRADGTFVSATNVRAHCQSNWKSYDWWKDKFKTGLPGRWPYPKEKSKPWTEEEKERMFEALDEVPDQLKLKTINGLYRFAHSQSGDNPSTWVEGGMIGFYDSAFENHRLARVLSHELAHEYYDQMGAGQEQYEEVAGEKVTKSGSSGPSSKQIRTEGFVEEDGNRGFEEDFANNLEYFLFEPKVLQSVTPSVYNWMREHFGSKFSVQRPK